MKRIFQSIVSIWVALFLTGTVSVSYAAGDNRANERTFTVSRLATSVKFIRNYQERRPPVAESLIKPTVRRNPTPDQIYRHNRARDALKSGRIVALSVIRQRVRQSFPGKIVDVRLLEPKKKNKAYLYMVKVLRKDGKLIVIKVNASTAKIITVRGSG